MKQANNPFVRPASPTSVLFIGVIGVLTAFGPFAIDTYLPAMPTIARELGTSQVAVQWTLSSFFAGLSLGQILFGVASDRYGRRLTLLVGAILGVVTSALAGVSPSVELLIGARFVQGLAAASGTAVTRAAIRDVYSGDAGSRAMTSAMNVMIVAPMIAPFIGSQIEAYVGWRAIFAFMAAFSLACVALIYMFLPETLPVERRSEDVTFMARLRTFGPVLTHRRSLLFLICGCMNTGLLFAYIASTSFVFIEHFGMTEVGFSIFFALGTFGIIAGNVLNSRYVERFGTVRVLGVGLVIGLVGSAFIAFAGWMQFESYLTVAVPVYIVASTIGVVAGNALAGMLDAHPEHAGVASALFGVCQYATGAFCSAIVGLFANRVLGMGGLMVFASLLAFGAWALIVVGDRRASATS